MEHQQLLPRVLASGVRRNCFSTAFWDTGTVSAGLDAMYAHAWYYGLSLCSGVQVPCVTHRVKLHPFWNATVPCSPIIVVLWFVRSSPSSSSAAYYTVIKSDPSARDHLR